MIRCSSQGKAGVQLTFMVIPDGDPCIVLEAGNGVGIETVAVVSRTVIKQRSNFGIGLGYTTNGPAPAVGTLGVLVDEITQMDNIVDRLLASRIAKGGKETEVVVGARINGQFDCSNWVVGVGSGLGLANWARVGGIAHRELVVILCECLQTRGLDLDGVVNIR